MEDKDINIIDTDEKKEHGTNRCPNCHSSDVTYNTKKKKLICNYCYTEFDDEKLDLNDAKDLVGVTRTTGVKDIKKDANDIITLKCSGCGAEVVINTNEATNARCHWCRSILSINSQIDNGAIPDVVLPFSLTKEEGQKKIKEFVDERTKYANETFKNEFTTKNIMGVYFPYMLVDANCHANFKGTGEHLVKKYTVKEQDKEVTKYDADLYSIERDFDISIDDLTIESSLDKLNKNSKDKTTNIINSIMPFDTENCVKYKANYLAGYTSEKRDINISNIEDKVDSELKDVTRHSLNEKLSFYNRGVKWDYESLSVKGKQWVSAYLPVWLYSYQDENKVLHYVAVNARTGETMGSVPMNKGKILRTAFLIDLFIFLAILLLYFITQSSGIWVLLFLLLSGIIFYSTQVSKYRNKAARHTYEKETKHQITNLKENDKLLEHRERLNNQTMQGANNKSIKGEYTKINIEE